MANHVLPGKDELRRIASILSVILAIVLLIGLGIAVFDGPLASPPAWLTDWTDWLVSALTVVFAPLVLVDLAAALRTYAKRL